MKQLIRNIFPKPVVKLLRKVRDAVVERPVIPILDKRASLDFAGIYEQNGFDGTESRSGGGSTLEQTKVISREIPLLVNKLDVRRFLDVPCGDLNWMQHIDLGNVKYIGGDVVQSIIDANRAAYSNANRSFERMDIITGPLPASDMIFCRDCLVHLNYSDGLSALKQFRHSGAKWLLTTTFVDRACNEDLYPEGAIWRPLNLEKAPYNMPPAALYINENCTEGNGLYSDKCLALWPL